MTTTETKPERYSPMAVAVSTFNAATYRYDDEVVYPDATLRQESGDLDRVGLRIAVYKHPDTGTEFDDVGDRAIDYRTMAAAKMHVGSDGYIHVEGFVEERHPDEDDSNIEPGAFRGRPTGRYLRQRWTQFLYDEEAMNDTDWKVVQR